MLVGSFKVELADDFVVPLGVAHSASKEASLCALVQVGTLVATPRSLVRITAPRRRRRHAPLSLFSKGKERVRINFHRYTGDHS